MSLTALRAYRRIVKITTIMNNPKNKKHMKRNFMFIAVMLLSGAMAMAQTANVKKANNALLTDPVNYDEARSYIEQAKQDPSTATDAKTWYVAGRIGYSLANKEWNKRYINQNPDADLLYTGLKEMFENYLKADSFDGKELDKKGNPKYTQRKGIKGDLKEMQNCFIDAGAAKFDQRDYEKAYEMFTDYVAVADLPIFDEKERAKVKIDSTYNQIKYYAAISALRAEKSDEALKLLDEITKTDYADKQAVYELMSNVYQSQGDTAKYVQSLKDGLEAYPKSEFFIGSLVNHYVTTRNYKEALDYVDGVIAKQPDNMEYVNLKAELLIQLGKYDEARAAINDMLDKDRSAVNLYLMGKSYAIEGGNIQDAASDPSLSNAAYDREIAKAKKIYAEALKYFEEAKPKMDKSDSRYTAMLQVMKTMYIQTKGSTSAEFKAIDAELKSIQ